MFSLSSSSTSIQYHQQQLPNQVEGAWLGPISQAAASIPGQGVAASQLLHAANLQEPRDNYVQRCLERVAYDFGVASVGLTKAQFVENCVEQAQHDLFLLPGSSSGGAYDARVTQQIMDNAVQTWKELATPHIKIWKENPFYADARQRVADNAVKTWDRQFALNSAPELPVSQDHATGGAISVSQFVPAPEPRVSQDLATGSISSAPQFVPDAPYFDNLNPAVGLSSEPYRAEASSFVQQPRLHSDINSAISDLISRKIQSAIDRKIRKGGDLLLREVRAGAEKLNRDHGGNVLDVEAVVAQYKARAKETAVRTSVKRNRRLNQNGMSVFAVNPHASVN